MRHLSFFIDQLVSQSCTLRDRDCRVISVMPDPDRASVISDVSYVIPDLIGNLSADYQSIKSINL